MKNSVSNGKTMAGGVVASRDATNRDIANRDIASREVASRDLSRHQGAADPGYAPPLGMAHLLRDTYRFFARRLLSHISGSHHSEHRLTMGQYYILKELWRENGLTQRELSERIGIMEPTAVNTLKLMRRHGLIRKERNSRDRRKTNIFLTGGGQRLFSEILPFAEAVNAEAVLGFSAGELSALRGLLERMKKNLNGGDGGN
ncbi:MAG: winged helix-turn-helix transcriptional regulator [SAR324 cluster bacterium]|nr:winged helix-turn-helix transcriptional regulator [SAR324 cluster bacterium]